YPLVGTTSEDRIPDSSKLLEIADYVGSIDICPFCVDVIAAAFEIVEFNINITTLNPDTTTNRSAVENSLKQYMLDRFPRQYPDELYPTNYISTAELHKVCFDNGAQSVALSISKIGETSSLTGYTLQDNEVAEIGKIVWPG
ncbi:MAG: hypothetical protein GY760_03450, partial [Deltaproteobacteria bacterium]|nr:hypothetical protein [Deltaproteobacteria bacterium]